MMIPESFTPASWRGTIPVDKEADRLGISFDLKNGSIIRLSIDLQSAKQLAGSMTEYLGRASRFTPEEIETIAAMLESFAESRKNFETEVRRLGIELPPTA